MLMFMSPKFIQVGSYLGGLYTWGVYIWNVNWVSYLSDIYMWGANWQKFMVYTFYDIQN